MKIPWQFIVFFALAWLVLMLVLSYVIVGKIVFGPTIVGLVLFIGLWYGLLKVYTKKKNKK